jgi:subtilisin family serine protease
VTPPTENTATPGEICARAGLDQCEKLAQVLAREDADTFARLASLIDLEGMTLYLSIRDLLDGGALVVAASGNHASSAGALPPQIPAAYAADNRAVLAVAATTHGRERAAYSHAGTLAAPGGGNAVNSCEPGSRPDCRARLDSWVISVAQHDHPTVGRYWSYGAWIGTSFATPLVSGAAANEIVTDFNAEKAADRVRTTTCAPAAANADLGEGILCLP